MSGGVAFIALFFTVIIIAYFGRLFFVALGWLLKLAFYAALVCLTLFIIWSITMRWAPV